jgi:casein kinase II subunit alpha
MWPVGCMLVSMVFRREHFFKGMDNEDQLLKILQVLGTDKFDAYLQKYHIQFETDNNALLKE